MVNISFHPRMGEPSDSAGYLLLELTPALEQALTNETRDSGVTIKGGADDNAILCTKDKVFSLKSTGTSNATMVCTVSPDDGSFQVQACVDQIMSVQETEPVMHEVLTLLNSAPLTEQTDERMDLPEDAGADVSLGDDTPSPVHGFTFEDLLHHAQASVSQLTTYLESSGTVARGSDPTRYRLVGDTYVQAVFSLVLATCVAEGWPLDHVPGQEMATCLRKEQGFPEDIVAFVLRQHGTEVADTGWWTLDERKIQRFRGLELLTRSKHWWLDDFISAWAEALPGRMVPDLTSLSDLFIINSRNASQEISYFPERQLPVNVKDRFRRLFQERSKWAEAEIMPFISPLETSQLSCKKMLLSFARKSTKDGLVMYSSRY